MSAAVQAAGVNLRREPGGTPVLVLSGSLDGRTAAGTRRQIEAALAGESPPALEIDARGIAHADMSGVALLYALARGRFTGGKPAALNGLKPEFQRLLDAFSGTEEQEAAAERGAARDGVTRRLGAATVAVARDFSEQVTFVGGVTEAFGAAARRPRTMRWKEVAILFEKAGVDALPIVSLISLLTGVIIAFEASQPLEQFGAQIFIADMIGLVMVREFSPIFTAIILAGRSGSAFAAEIGTMKVNEELNALTTMGLDPLRFLVIQRVFAGTLLMPLLTAYSMLAGVFGGVLVMQAMGFPFAQIWAQLSGALHVRDVLVGTAKAFVFGAIVAGLGCLRGLQTRQGPTAVGDSTTRAVVAGIFMIILVDAVFAVLTYVLHI
jgi:phospholipid/cholesterol/gamma-HCH transport system permease protein